MLRINPKERITAKEALDHSWFDDDIKDLKLFYCNK